MVLRMARTMRSGAEGVTVYIRAPKNWPGWGRFAHRVDHNRRYFPSLMTHAESMRLCTYDGRVAFASC